MPLISTLSAGLKLSSTGNINTLAEIVLGSAGTLNAPVTSGAANPFFNSVYSAAATATTTGFTAPGAAIAGAVTTAYQNGGVNGNGQAAMFTVNPGAQAPGTTGMIVAGRALQLYVEYNSLGQFRFDVLPSAANVIASTTTGALTTPSLSSAWYPVNTEHTVGVSYNAAGYITMVVDGDFSSATTLAD
jgi:hypothetical protein